MNQLLTLDFGNSNAKVGLFKGDTFLKEISASLLEKENLDFGYTEAVLCSVKKYPEILQPLMKQGLHVTDLSEWWKGAGFDGMKVNYAQTLGLDRLLAAHFVYTSLKKEALVIDAGTYLTIDVVNKDGFEGGYILPGFHKIGETLKQGENLFSPTLDLESLTKLPHDTNSALQGYGRSVSLLIKKLLSDYKLSMVVLTGGEAQLIKPILNSTEIYENAHLLHFSMKNWWKRQGHQ